MLHCQLAYRQSEEGSAAATTPFHTIWNIGQLLSITMETGLSADGKHHDHHIVA